VLDDSALGPPQPPGSHHLRGLYAATAISVTGDGVLVAAAPLAAASLTQSAWQVGVVSAAGYAAWIFAGLPAGAMVDRSPLRAVMVASDLVRAAALLLLVGLLVLDRAAVWSLGAVALVLGIGSCFFDPAAQATIPALSGREPTSLQRINGRYWALDTLGRSLVGPPAGALLFAVYRPLPFVLDAVSFVVSAVLVARVSHIPAPTPGPHLQLWSAVRAGLQEIWARPQLRAAALGMGAYNFGWSMANATMVLFAIRELGLSEKQFGLVLACAAIGGVIGGSAHRLIGHAEIHNVYALVLALQSAAWACVGLTDSTQVLLVTLVVVGFANTAISTAGAAVRQLHAAHDVLGRVIAGTRTLGVGATAVGAVCGGLTASQLGLVGPFYCAAVWLIVAALGFRLAPTLRPGPL
jgi:MFS family permease